MKKGIIGISVLLLLFAFQSCTTTHVVRERPGEVVYHRPSAPGPDYVWISGNWMWRGGSYVWREGYWERRHVGRVWIEGHWRRSRGGWVWEPGHWTRA